MAFFRSTDESVARQVAIAVIPLLVGGLAPIMGMALNYVIVGHGIGEAVAEATVRYIRAWPYAYETVLWSLLPFVFLSAYLLFSKQETSAFGVGFVLCLGIIAGLIGIIPSFLLFWDLRRGSAYGILAIAVLLTIARVLAARRKAVVE
jgi:hypothetical protein